MTARASTQEVAEFILGTSYDRLPLPVITLVKKVIIDSIGVALAAHALNDKAVEAARNLAVAMGGREESTLIGAGVKTPCNIAALVNSIMGSTLDFDDGANAPDGGAICHPGGMIVPASLAVAEARHASGRQLIEAVVIGYEVTLAAGLMMMGIPGASGKRGVYGAAAAAARLLKLDSVQTVNALGIAEAHRPDRPLGLIGEKPPMTKEAMGWAAMTGVTAALLAQAGFTGPRTLFDLHDSSNDYVGTLGREWRILGVYFKPYSVCRYCHTAIDGVLKLIKEHHLRAGDVSKVSLGVSSAAAKLADYAPATTWEAQYSLPFAIAAALVDGEVGPEQITRKLSDADLRAQLKKVNIAIDPEVEAVWPRELMAKVVIEMNDGRKFNTCQRCPKGDPGNPLSEAEFSEKFRKLATMAIGSARAKGLEDTLSRLETLGSLDHFMAKIKSL